MALLVSLSLAFLTSLLAPLVHRCFKSYSAWLLALVPGGLTVYFASLSQRVSNGQPIRASYEWIPSLGIELSFYIDGLSLLFLLLISFIGALVVLYTGEYLRGHERLGRFYAYLFFFMGSMLGLVASDNLIVMFVFWELTSLSSFLLIGFDHEKEQARKSALQALLITGGGGLALMAGLIMIGGITGDFSLTSVLTKGEMIRSHPLVTPITLLILLGAWTKSAQFPFHFWLPNAMAAPTPVSAYLHSATMVKAGIYLLARFSPVLGGTSLWHNSLVLVGCVTAVIGPLLALTQTDLKRLLAYSTIGALGILTLLIGVGTEDAMAAAVVCLVVHSLYKGSLFMVAGAVDHETGTRDVLGLCGLIRAMPVTSLAAGLAALSMAGFPPLFGFIGKELIYQAKLDSPDAGWITFGLGVFSNVVMVAIAFMVGVEPFFGRKLVSPRPPHEAPFRLWVGPLLLSIIGLCLGLFPSSIAESVLTSAAVGATGTPSLVKLNVWHGWNMVLLFSFITFGAGIFLFYTRERIRSFLDAQVGRFVWGPERIYVKSLDGLLSFATWLTRTLQNGRLTRYLLVILVCLVSLVTAAIMQDASSLWTAQAPSEAWHDVALMGIVSIAALIAAFCRSRILSVSAIAVVGFAIGGLYAIFSAPDVAITQILVETLSVVLTVFLISRIPEIPARLRSTGHVARITVAVFAGLSMGLLCLLTLAHQPLEPPISSYFVENSVIEAQGRTIVNVILVDFRALDTMGEVTVLVIAAVGVAALLSIKATSQGRST